MNDFVDVSFLISQSGEFGINTDIFDTGIINLTLLLALLFVVGKDDLLWPILIHQVDRAGSSLGNDNNIVVASWSRSLREKSTHSAAAQHEQENNKARSRSLHLHWVCVATQDCSSRRQCGGSP